MCTEALAGVGILPVYGAWGLVVVTDVAHELIPQIGDRDERAAFDPSEPQLDGIGPGGMGRGEM